MRRSATVFVLTAILGVGCDKLTGGGNNVSPTTTQGAAAPGQTGASGQTAVPQQTGVSAAGQAAALPAQATAANAVTGQVAGAVAGQQTLPTQPGAATAAQTAAAASATPPTPTGDALTDKVNSKKFEVAPAFQATSALLKQVLKKKTPQIYQVQLAGPPYCQTFVAAAADGVADINLKLEDPAGAVAAKDNVAGNVAVIANYCPTVPGSYKLTVEIPGGEGEFAVQVFSK